MMDAIRETLDSGDPVYRAGRMDATHKSRP
jgi:hypothetical protein